ncbi:hypothetical protein [Microvirga yunnanensis]|uniref:hypothetical protein n=1 Tax=Microvirga yunnanensis TaxID=2953740 RepID=UPI0021C8185E|nr:hypothetical protein [Microvirga sp. HBU67655]
MTTSIQSTGILPAAEEIGIVARPSCVFAAPSLFVQGASTPDGLDMIHRCIGHNPHRLKRIDGTIDERNGS